MKRASLLLLLALLPACVTSGPAKKSGTSPTGPRTYYGILPCPLDCRNVGTELTIMEGHRFALEETFHTKQGADTVEQSFGEWTLVSGHGKDPNAKMYELTSEQFEQERYFLRVSDDVLRALDEQGSAIATKDNVMLKRIKNK